MVAGVLVLAMLVTLLFRGGSNASALGESGLIDVDHGDRDSLGLFQQRANWGTAAQRMDPMWATTAFLTAPSLGLLVKVPGWARLDPWVVAQETQESAWDGRSAQEQ